MANHRKSGLKTSVKLLSVIAIMLAVFYYPFIMDYFAEVDEDTYYSIAALKGVSESVDTMIKTAMVDHMLSKSEAMAIELEANSINRKIRVGKAREVLMEGY